MPSHRSTVVTLVAALLAVGSSLHAEIPVVADQSDLRTSAILSIMNQVVAIDFDLAPPRTCHEPWAERVALAGEPCRSAGGAIRSHARRGVRAQRLSYEAWVPGPDH